MVFLAGDAISFVYTLMSATYFHGGGRLLWEDILVTPHNALRNILLSPESGRMPWSGGCPVHCSGRFAAAKICGQTYR